MNKAQPGRHVAPSSDSKTKSSHARSASSARQPRSTRNSETRHRKPDSYYEEPAEIKYEPAEEQDYSFYSSIDSYFPKAEPEYNSEVYSEPIREQDEQEIYDYSVSRVRHSVEYYENDRTSAPEARRERVAGNQDKVPSRISRSRDTSAERRETRTRKDTGYGTHSEPADSVSSSRSRVSETRRGRSADSERVERVQSERRNAPVERPGNKTLFIAGYICVLLGFICGSAEVLSFKEARVSEKENRMLQGFPELSAQSVISGTFMSEMESYLSDAFFFRDEVADFTEQQLGMFALPGDDLETWDVDAEHLDAPVEDQPDSAPETVSAEASSEGTVQSTEKAEEPATAAAVASASVVDISQVSKAGLYLTNDNGETKAAYTFSPEQMLDFAQMLNNYRAALPEDGTLHYAAPPVSATANNILQTHKYTGWYTDLDDILNPVVDDGVCVYDVATIVTPYLETSRLYPVSDHHWHPLTASLVCQSMISNQGIAPVDYYEYRYYVNSLSMRETIYGDDLKALSLPSDTIEIMEPLSPVQAYKVKKFDQLTDSVFIDFSKGSLISYLGGLQPGPWRKFVTGFHTGRTAIIITDSFGLTFTPYLMPYYDVVIFADLRESCFSLAESGGTIREYIDYYGATDMYMLSSAYDPGIVSQVESRLHKYLG